MQKVDLSARKSANPSFRFIVSVAFVKQGVFTECTLPVIEWETEEIKEGGLNTYTHVLPTRRKGGRITLKKGVGTSSLVGWCMSGMFETYQRLPVTIELVDSHLVPVMTWVAEDAYPVKWTGPNLKSDDNTIAIQTFELACGEINVIPGAGIGVSLPGVSIPGII